MQPQIRNALLTVVLTSITYISHAADSAASATAASAAVAAVSVNSPLATARNSFKTEISLPSLTRDAAPLPPSALFSKISYPSAVGPLSAYLTPDPKDGLRHAAIIWITGGDCNSMGDMWTEDPRSNDQTAAAYRKAGMVLMGLSLRGGNDNPGHREAFYGEVDDVLAAYDFLARQPYVDPTRIYLGGHSTGGTLALLTAETRNPFRAVFAFGAVAFGNGYAQDLFPVDFTKFDKRELLLRSPVYWLASAKGNVFVIEGADLPSNNNQLLFMKQYSHNPALHFLTVTGVNHFSVLGPSNDAIAAKIVHDAGGTAPFDLTEADLQAQVK